MAEDALKFVCKLLAYGGGSAAIAYLLFQFLGKTWIENKFKERLDQLKHQQALELQRLRVEIDALLSGAIKLQEREFDVLPEAWLRLNDAHSLVRNLVSPLQEYPDLDHMNQARLEEFLASSEFTETEKNDIRLSSKKVNTYKQLIFYYRLRKVKIAFSELQRYIAQNGIFFPLELKEKFAQFSEILWSALISKEVGHEANDYKMQREGWTEIKEKAEPLYKAIEIEIQSRLQSHGRKSSTIAN